MSKKIVISQSMYFPWVGMLEQIKLADIFVHYDDVQFSSGGFLNRVQVKTSKESKWMTIPLKNKKLKQNIKDVQVQPGDVWKNQHLSLLKQAYHDAPYKEVMIEMIEELFNQDDTNLASISRKSTKILSSFFEIDNTCQFIDSEDLEIEGSGSQRVHDIVVKLGGDEYITGHGAKNYLDHDLFEESGIEVKYMNYELLEYPQLHGEFTPFCTALDLVANCGKDGKKMIKSTAINWKNFLYSYGK